MKRNKFQFKMQVNILKNNQSGVVYLLTWGLGEGVWKKFVNKFDEACSFCMALGEHW